MAFDPKSVAPAVNPMFDALFSKLSEAKAPKGEFAPNLVPGNIVRDPSKPPQSNCDWVSWVPAEYLVEIQSFEVKAQGIQVKVQVLESTGDTAKGQLADVFFSTGPKNFKFADQMADFISAVHNVHIKEPDPANMRQPLIRRLSGEATSPANPLLGKKVRVRSTADRAKKPGDGSNKCPVGEHGVYVNLRFFPVDQTTGAPLEDKRFEG